MHRVITTTGMHTRVINSAAAENYFAGALNALSMLCDMVPWTIDWRSAACVYFEALLATRRSLFTHLVFPQRRMMKAATCCMAAALMVTAVSAQDPADSWLAYAKAPGNGNLLTYIDATWVVPAYPTMRNGGPGRWLALREPVFLTLSAHRTPFDIDCSLCSPGLLVWH